jgi:hypothetical protein
MIPKAPTSYEARMPPIKGVQSALANSPTRCQRESGSDRSVQSSKPTCFALINEQIVSPLGRHWDDRLLRDGTAGQACYPERPVLQLFRSYDFLHGGGDLNHDNDPSRET